MCVYIYIYIFSYPLHVIKRPTEEFDGNLSAYMCVCVCVCVCVCGCVCVRVFKRKPTCMCIRLIQAVKCEFQGQSFQLCYRGFFGVLRSHYKGQILQFVGCEAKDTLIRRNKEEFLREMHPKSICCHV